MREDKQQPDTADSTIAAVHDTVRRAASSYARRFGITQHAEDIEAESLARIIRLTREARPPFDQPSDDPATIDRQQRFSNGLVANVAREALRGQLGRQRLRERSRDMLASGLCNTEKPPEARAELRETIDKALGAFRELDRAARTTILAEEIMKNDYPTPQIESLCRSCGLTSQEVTEMIELRSSGRWTAEAWRQRVHRSRNKARDTIGGAFPFPLASALVLVIAAVLAASTPATTPGAQGDTAAPTAPIVQPLVKKDDSTQNGKAVVRLASTQNGKAKKKSVA